MPALFGCAEYAAGCAAIRMANTLRSVRGMSPIGKHEE